MQKTYDEGILQLAIQAINYDKIESERCAVVAFGVPRSALQDRRAGALSRRDRKPNSKRLTKLEEEAVVRYTLDLDTRGIGATRAMVRDMASDLLAERGEQPVSKHWVDNFAKRTPKLKLRRSCTYDR